jgi:septal ring factor EnvC (AmiA/AmiB activator)
MKPLTKFFLAMAIMVSVMAVNGCSSSPSDQELQQLDQLKKDVAALEKQVSDKQADKAGIEKQIADKNAKLKQCQSDQDAVKKALGK